MIHPLVESHTQTMHKMLTKSLTSLALPAQQKGPCTVCAQQLQTDNLRVVAIQFLHLPNEEFCVFFVSFSLCIGFLSKKMPNENMCIVLSRSVRVCVCRNVRH